MRVQCCVCPPLQNKACDSQPLSPEQSISNAMNGLCICAIVAFCASFTVHRPGGATLNRGVAADVCLCAADLLANVAIHRF